MAAAGPRILVVDDSPDDTLLATDRLKRSMPGLVCERVDDADGMRDALAREHWDVVISDHAMPRFDSIEALELLRKAQPGTPFIVYSGHYDRARVLEALRAGADDCVEKADPQRLVPAVARALARTADPAQARVSRDLATGLPGRGWLEDRLVERIETRRDDVGCLALARIELDRVQRITEAFGRATTDRLLGEVARRLQETLGPSDLLARVDDGAFAALLDRCDQPHHAERRTRALVAALAAPITQDGNTFYVTASAGYATFPTHARGAEALWKLCDAAIVRAREQGVNRVEGPAPADRAPDGAPDPVPASELFLMAHPIMSTTDNGAWGVEVVARRQHASLGLLAPNPDAPVEPAPPGGSTVASWLVDQAVGLAVRMRGEGKRDARVAVALSRRLLSDPDIGARLAEGLAAGGLNGDALEIEVSEAWVLAHPRRAEILARELKRSGLRVALDDFGTTYGALAPLQNLHLDTLKLAPALVRDARGGRGREAALEGAVALARALGARIVARGVESETERDRLRALGVDRVQGPLFPAQRPARMPDAVAPVMPELKLVARK